LFLEDEQTDMTNRKVALRISANAPTKWPQIRQNSQLENCSGVNYLLQGDRINLQA